MLDYSLTWGEGCESHKYLSNLTWIFEPRAFSSTNHLSMSILRDSVTAGKVILFIDASSAWDQASQLKKRRKISAIEASREVVWGGKRVAPPFPPSPGHRSARFFRRYFSYLTPFFAFFPDCGAWSRANDSYAMKLEKLPLKDKIIASCHVHIIVNYKQQKGTLKNWQVNKFSKTTIKICFNLLQVYQSLLPFV